MPTKPYSQLSEEQRKRNIRQVTEHRKRKKSRAVDYKGGKCRVCGYKRCLGALQFHHLDPSQKDFSINQAAARSWEYLRAELDKCVLLCGNCHVEVHDGLVDLRAILTSEEIALATAGEPTTDSNILSFFSSIPR